MQLRAIGALVALTALLGLGACENRENNTAQPGYLPVLAAPLLTIDLAQGAVDAPPPQAEPRDGPSEAKLKMVANLAQGGWMRGQFTSQAKSVRLDGTELALDDNGRFFAGFDRDAPSEMLLTAVLADGSEYRHRIELAARDWQIEHVDVAMRPSGTSEAFLERRRPELAAIHAARAKETGAQGWRQPFIWPVNGRISGRFGSQRIYRGEPGSYHSGLDIAPGAGTPFAAPADGVVVLAADDFSLEGKLLIIDHGQGLNSAFLHASQLFVREGDQVRQGQHIGNVGASGRATGPHLHWSLKWRDARLDPLLFLRPAS